MVSDVSEAVVLEDFVTKNQDLWEKRHTGEDIEYTKNGFPQEESTYNRAKHEAVPGAEFSDPYRVTDFSEKEIDTFAQRPDSLAEEELQALKNVRAAYTVQHAYENVPFYQDLLDEHDVDPYMVEGVDDLQELPVIDGDDILANQPPATDSFRLENPDAQTRRILNTSGSTGNPKEFKKSYDEISRIAEDVAFWAQEYDIGNGDTIVNYFPFVGMNASGIGVEESIEEIGATSIAITNTPYPPEVEANKLLRYGASQKQENDSSYVLAGLASHIDSKGKQFEQAGFDPEQFGVDTILLAGEPVSEGRKQNIAETYDADVYEFLGSTESGGYAYECTENRDRLHVIDHSVHVDIIDSETEERLDEGERGSVTVTNLLHPGEESAMPLINYDHGDLTTEYESGDCSCQYRGSIDIRPPRRDSWDFILGAVNLNPTFFEDNIYEHTDLADVTEDYQLRVDYDEERGQDTLDVVIASKDNELVDQEATFHSVDGSVTVDEDSSPIAKGIGYDFLNSHSHLADTVSVGGARFNVAIVDEIEMPPGKPQRLIDERDL